MRREKEIGFLVALVLLLLLPAQSVFSQGKPLVVVFAKGMLKANLELNYMMGNISQVEWKVFTDTITYDDIKDAIMVILVQVDTGANYTQSEISAIKQWMGTGSGKVLWITGDSDYQGGDYLRIAPANAVAETVGSRLRDDSCEATDPGRAPAKPYHVVADITPDKELSVLADGVSGWVLFHGPGAIAAYDNGKWYTLVDQSLDNIYRIAWTSEKGAIQEYTPPLPSAYKVGYVGRILEMAAEVLSNNNIVLFSAEAPFDHYRGMWNAAYEEFPSLSGPQFVTNVVLWGAGLKGTKPTYVTFWTKATPYIAGGIVVLIVVVALYFLVIKKKK
jgi:hypothetical protein